MSDDEKTKLQKNEILRQEKKNRGKKSFFFISQ